MEYSELIHKILTAEQNAQEIARESKSKRESLESDLQKEIEQLRESYLDRARRRLVQTEQQEEEAAQAAYARLDQKLAADMAAVESALAENEEKWTDVLFHMVIGDAS